MFTQQNTSDTDNYLQAVLHMKVILLLRAKDANDDTHEQEFTTLTADVIILVNGFGPKGPFGQFGSKQWWQMDGAFIAIQGCEPIR